MVPTLLGLAVLSGVVSAHAAERHGVQLEGVLQTVVTDDFASGTATTRHELVTADGGRVALVADGAAISAPPGARVRVAGTPEGKGVRAQTVDVLDGPWLLGSTIASPQRVAVVLVNFDTDPSEAWTVDQVRERVFTAPDSVNAYWQELSGGDLSLTGILRPDGDVLGWYTIPRGDPARCEYYFWIPAAQAAALAAGIDLALYDRLIFLWQEVPCNGGQADLGGQRAWVNDLLLTGVIAHEMGHLFGLWHASGWECVDEAGQRVTIGRLCTHNEYDGGWDVMGYDVWGDRPHHTNNVYKRLLGFLPAGEPPAGGFQTVTSSGVYTIAPAGAALPGEVQGLRIPNPRLPDGEYPATYDYSYVLEFRQPFGFFDVFAPDDPVVNGVSVRVEARYSSATITRLLDTTLETYGVADYPIAPGRVFHDGKAVTIRTLAVTPAGATVEVTIDPDTVPPTTPGNLRGVALGPNRVELSWDPATDDRGVEVYRIFRGAYGDVIGATAGTTFLDVTAISNYNADYEVRAEDASGNQSPGATRQVVTPHYNPVVMMKAPREGDLARPRLHVNARATGDARIESMEILVDGAVVFSRVYSEFRNVRASRRIRALVRLDDLPSGPHVIAVRAREGLGVGLTGVHVVRP